MDRAIGFERALDEAQGHVTADIHTDHAAGDIHPSKQPELLSQQVQSNCGLFTGVGVYSTAFCGLFALVFAVANQRVVKLSPRAVSALLDASGLITVYVAPTLK